MSQYVHVFKVAMLTTTDSPVKAKRWMMARLIGGDADFGAEHLSVRKLSEEEERRADEEGKWDEEPEAKR
jgi:hypothetical protein